VTSCRIGPILVELLYSCLTVHNLASKIQRKCTEWAFYCFFTFEAITDDNLKRNRPSIALIKPKNIFKRIRKMLDSQNGSCIFYKNSKSKKNWLGFFELHFKFCSNLSAFPKHLDLLETLRSSTNKTESLLILPMSNDPKIKLSILELKFSGWIFSCSVPVFS
jgi:phage pi2 protein 07